MRTSNLCIRFSTLRSLKFEMKALHNRHSHVGHSKLIHGLTQIRYVGLNCFKHRALKWKLQHGAHENFNIWTGPKIKTICKVLKIVAKSILFTLTRLSDKESSSFKKRKQLIIWLVRFPYNPRSLHLSRLCRAETCRRNECMRL